MNVLVTGASGFLGKNLIITLAKLSYLNVMTFSKADTNLAELVEKADIIFHLAGVNRPTSNEEFLLGNSLLSETICDLVKKQNRNIPIVFASSIQAAADNPYGQSKLAAENHFLDLEEKTGNSIYIYRLPNVFGKWCKPNYNSVVATFCYNIANNLPISIHDKNTKLELVHVGDVVTSFIRLLKANNSGVKYIEIDTIYRTTIEHLADRLYSYRDSRSTLIVDEVGSGFDRVLYATYISYFYPDSFSYSLVKHEDPRGTFVEMLKTKNSGQFSYFTAHPGITRGGHYHNIKTEKFLVIKGIARFGFRHIATNEYKEMVTQGSEPLVVETVPGWSHDITNIGDEELIVMLWANENFNPNAPDTVNFKV